MVFGKKVDFIELKGRTDRHIQSKVELEINVLPMYVKRYPDGM